MKFTYLTEGALTKDCPCGSHLIEYAQSISPRSATLDLTIAQRLREDENTYTAAFNVYLANNQGYYQLEVSCTILPNRTYSYKTLSKSDIRQK